jgi:hypothetical protein
MVHANPGLRPGLGSAVPTGLDFEMVNWRSRFPRLVEQPEQAPFLGQ